MVSQLVPTSHRSARHTFTFNNWSPPCQHRKRTNSWTPRATWHRQGEMAGDIAAKGALGVEPSASCMPGRRGNTTLCVLMHLPRTCSMYLMVRCAACCDGIKPIWRLACAQPAPTGLHPQLMQMRASQSSCSIKAPRININSATGTRGAQNRLNLIEFSFAG